MNKWGESVKKYFSKKFEKSVDIWEKICYYIQALERNGKNAGVAQPVEQLICNQQVGGSSPSTSSNIWEISRVAKGGRL